MAIVTSLILVLSRTPLSRTGLGSDDGKLGPLSQNSLIHACIVHAKRAQSTYIDLLHLLFEIKVVFGDLFAGLHEITCVVDNDINGTAIALDPLDGLTNRLLVGNINSFVCTEDVQIKRARYIVDGSTQQQSKEG